MKIEERQLLLKDLCMRLPYGVIVQYPNIFIPSEITNRRLETISYSLIGIDEYRININDDIDIEYVKPYLRPMSSMTEEEATAIFKMIFGNVPFMEVNVTETMIEAFIDDGVCSYEREYFYFNEIIKSIDILDFLNKNHFDYRGLIEKGLAIEAPKNMYKK